MNDKRIFKKAGVLLFAALLTFCLSAPVPAAAKETAYQGKPDFYSQLVSLEFQDMMDLPVDHWSAPAVYTMAALGVIKGSSGNFYPNDTATRSEALAVLFRTSGLDADADAMYRVVQQQRQLHTYNTVDTWADGYLRLALDMELINLDQYMSAMDQNYSRHPSPLFAKDKPVTRGEIAIWMVLLLELPVEETPQHIMGFSDYASIPEADRPYLEAAVKAGMIKGLDGKLLPQETITREQMAQMFYNMLDAFLEKGNMEKKAVQVTGVDVTTTNLTGKIQTDTIFTFIDGTDLSTQRQYDMVGEAVDTKNINPDNAYKDIPVIAAKSMPTDTSVLKTNDRVYLITNQEGELLLILLNNHGGSTLYEDGAYTDSGFQKGTVYLYNYDENVMLLKMEDGNYAELLCLDNVEFYFRNNKLDAQSVNQQWLDKPAYVMTVRPNGEETDFVYRVQYIQ